MGPPAAAQSVGGASASVRKNARSTGVPRARAGQSWDSRGSLAVGVEPPPPNSERARYHMKNIRTRPPSGLGRAAGAAGSPAAAASPPAAGAGAATAVGGMGQGRGRERKERMKGGGWQGFFFFFVGAGH